MPATTFRPETDGYAFANTWVLDEAERQQVRQIVSVALPAAVGVLSPIIAALSPVIIGTLGPALALIAPFLPILPCIAPLLAQRLVDSIADDVADHATGWCGGMAFSAMDYYSRNWVLPCGDGVNDQPQPLSAGGTAASDALRSYIWQRQIDAEFADAGTFLSWIAMTTLFGSYGREWVRDRTEEEMSKLQAKTLAGNSWPIGLLGGEDPTQSHYVNAISLEQIGPCVYRIEAYDNRFPDQTCTLDIDLSGSEANITESSGDTWLGVFCANYSPSQPPVAMASTSPLSVSPPWFGTARQPIQATFGACYQGFHVSRPLHFAVEHQNLIDGEEPSTTRVVMNEGDARLPGAPIAFTEILPWTYPFVPAIGVFPRGGGAPSYKVLSNEDGTGIAPRPFTVNPPIQIRIKRRGGDSCSVSTAAGADVILSADTSYFGASAVTGYSWQVSGGVVASSMQSTLNITLPGAAQAVHVQVVISLSDGTDAIGVLDFSPIDAGLASRMEMLCHFRRTLFRNPVSVIPFNPGDPYPDGLLNPAIRKTIDPAGVVRTMEQSAQSMRRILEGGGIE